MLLFIHAYGIFLYINCIFCFGQISTLVAMATFSLLWTCLDNSQVNVFVHWSSGFYRMISVSHIYVSYRYQPSPPETVFSGLIAS